MKPVRPLLVAFLCIGLSTPAVCFSENVYQKEMPKEDDIPFGKIVYVDAGRCPKGEVKEVTGSSRERAVPRKVRCVKRPDKAPRT